MAPEVKLARSAKVISYGVRLLMVQNRPFSVSDSLPRQTYDRSSSAGANRRRSGAHILREVRWRCGRRGEEGGDHDEHPYVHIGRTRSLSWDIRSQRGAQRCASASRVSSSLTPLTWLADLTCAGFRSLTSVTVCRLPSFKGYPSVRLYWPSVFLFHPPTSRTCGRTAAAAGHQASLLYPALPRR